MKIEQCPRGHFFDAHRHGACPLCPGEPEAQPAQAPTVGWLVCTQPPRQGMDFRLRPGRNLLGSGPEAQILIPWLTDGGEAVICYDEELKLFSFGPRSGTPPVQVNGKTIQDAVILHSGDRLTVGGTALLFVPLCGKDFHWAHPTKRRED